MNNSTQNSFGRALCLRWRALLAVALVWLAGPAWTLDLSLPLRAWWPGGPRGPALAVVVSGNYAYVATGVGGLLVLDVSDPAKPRRLGGYASGKGVESVAVAGNYAYLAEGTAGLEVVDIRNPADLGSVNVYDTSGQASGVAVAGDYA